MSNDEKVIPLDERRKNWGGKGGKIQPAPVGGPSGENAQPPSEEGPLEPLPGKLIWLHCPKCNTLQYTEVWIPGGRVHNLCGTEVEEAELEIDVRGELTIAEANLKRLEMLGQVLEAERTRYEEYRERLTTIAGGAPEPYPLDEERLRRFPIAEMGPLGLLVTEALYNPARHFQPPPAPAEKAGPASPPSGANSPSRQPPGGPPKT